MRDNDIIEIEETATAKRKQPKRKKTFWGKLWGNYVVRNILYVIIGAPLFLFAVHVALLIGTQHNRSFPVPDFTGMTLAEALEQKESEHLRLEIIDSVYVPHRAKGTIFKQVPEPHAQVKNNRRILLTINAHAVRRVPVPDVVGYSLRQAKAVLASQNLVVGKLTYEADIATNNVLAQYYKGTRVAKGKQIEAGSAIDLVLGRNGAANQRTIIPALSGLSAEAAKDLLLYHSLNSVYYYDKTVKTYADSLSARVYRQTPSPSSANVWPLGTRVEVYLKQEEPKAEAE